MSSTTVSQSAASCSTKPPRGSDALGGGAAGHPAGPSGEPACAARAPAPGPVPLLLPPAPERVATLPYHAFHPLGVERRRAETVRLACRHARRLEEAATLATAEAHRRLTALPGIGQWTAAEVALVALGD